MRVKEFTTFPRFRGVPDTNIDIHFHVLAVLGSTDSTLRASFVNSVRTDPDRVDFVELVRDIQGFLELVERDEIILSRLAWIERQIEQYLNNVSVFVVLLDSIALSGLQERDARRHQPSKQPAEKPVVTHRQYQFHFPKERFGVTMVVLTQRDVLDGFLALVDQLFSVLEPPLSMSLVKQEIRRDIPRLVPSSNVIDITVISRSIAEFTIRQDTTIVRILKTFQEFRRILCDREFRETINHLINSQTGFIYQATVLFARNDTDFERDDETDSTMRPGNSTEEIGIFSFRARDERTVAENNVNRFDDIVEQTVLVRRALDSITVHETTKGQVFKLNRMR